MAMFEQTTFEDVRGTTVGTADNGEHAEIPTVSSAPIPSVVATAVGPDACTQCGIIPVAICSQQGQEYQEQTRRQVNNGTTGMASILSTSSSGDTASISQSNSDRVLPLTTAAATTATATDGINNTTAAKERVPPTLGMRGESGGGAPGAGRPAEPVRGLKAFGSYGNLSGIAKEAAAPEERHNSSGPAGRLSTTHAVSGGEQQQQQHHPGEARRRGGEQTGASAASSAAAAKGHGSAGRGVGRSGSRGSSPAPPRGVGGAGASTGKSPPAAGASNSAGGTARPREPGYRVLEWSDLVHLNYMTAGAMCEIYSAELDGVKVAVKVPRKDCEEPAVAEHDLEVELDVLKRVNHKHIIALVGAGLREEKPQRFLALEFLELGTLADKLDAGLNKPDGSKESTFLRRQKRTKRYQDFYMVTMLERSLELAMALEHLHHHMPETFVVHRDLKPDNVGFKADGTLKLFDFGLARVVKRRNRVNARYEMTGETGSMRYMAPEVVESLPYNEKVDVYAFGLLLWEMLEDRRVFDGMGVSDFYERVVNAGARPNLDPTWPQDLRKLISQCWHADVDRRPNFRAIAERLRDLYVGEKHSSKLCMSALNLNEDEHPKLRGGSSVNMLIRSATTTNITGPTGGGPSSQTEIGKKGGMLRRSFSKIGRILKPNKGGAKATLVHTAPEAYSRPIVKGQPGHFQAENGRARGTGPGGNGRGGGLSEEAMYGDEESTGRAGGREEKTMKPRRAFSDGVVIAPNSPEKRT